MDYQTSEHSLPDFMYALTLVSTILTNISSHNALTTLSDKKHYPIVQQAVYNFMNSNWANMAIATTYSTFTNVLMVVYWGSIDWVVSVVADIDL